MTYLHNSKDQFQDAISLAYAQTGIMATAIEKDYYVTMLLRLLSEKMSYIVFKGGTSLSKCHKAILASSEELGLIIENLSDTRSRRDYNRYVTNLPFCISRCQYSSIARPDYQRRNL